MEKVESFKDRLNFAMKLRNIKAAELSRRTGISESTISQYRSGYAEPKRKKLGILADALSVSPAWLMGLDIPMHADEIIELNNSILMEKKHPSDDSELRLIEYYRRLNDLQKEAVMTMMESMGKDD
jgi:transcriptional regulator with XRE-family HTH domain